MQWGSGIKSVVGQILAQIELYLRQDNISVRKKITFCENPKFSSIIP